MIFFNNMPCQSKQTFPRLEKALVTLRQKKTNARFGCARQVQLHDVCVKLGSPWLTLLLLRPEVSLLSITYFQTDDDLSPGCQSEHLLLFSDSENDRLQIQC